jgi:hypothetical protein
MIHHISDVPSARQPRASAMPAAIVLVRPTGEIVSAGAGPD